MDWKCGLNTFLSLHALLDCVTCYERNKAYVFNKIHLNHNRFLSCKKFSKHLGKALLATYLYNLYRFISNAAEREQQRKRAMAEVLRNLVRVHSFPDSCCVSGKSGSRIKTFTLSPTGCWNLCGTTPASAWIPPKLINCRNFFIVV